MRSIRPGTLVKSLMLLCLLCQNALAGEIGPPPDWAYPVNPPGFKLSPDDGSIRRVPDSSAGFTVPQLRDLFSTPDWHPDDHAPMPAIVATGRKPDIRACGVCHRADGSGGPENASLAGLPFAYLVQQIKDYKNGARTFAEPRRTHQNLMNASVRGMTDPEVVEAASYFAGLKPRHNIKVVETNVVPATYIANWIFADRGTGEKEPILDRIVEVPDNLEQFESRDGRATFTAYAPVGSLTAGEQLVSGKVPAKVLPCSTCHGVDLRGTDKIPPIAGRSPSYIMRQLYEFRTGIRAGAEAQPMLEMLKNLDRRELTSIAAYLASLPR